MPTPPSRYAQLTDDERERERTHTIKFGHFTRLCCLCYTDQVHQKGMVERDDGRGGRATAVCTALSPHRGRDQPEPS